MLGVATSLCTRAHNHKHIAGESREVCHHHCGPTDDRAASFRSGNIHHPQHVPVMQVTYMSACAQSHERQTVDTWLPKHTEGGV
jgi:hypothetical protein